MNFASAPEKPSAQNGIDADVKGRRVGGPGYQAFVSCASAVLLCPVKFLGPGKMIDSCLMAYRYFRANDVLICMV